MAVKEVAIATCIRAVAFGSTELPQSLICVRPPSVFPFFVGGWKNELRTTPLVLLLLLRVLQLRLEVSVIAKGGCLREEES